MIFSKFCSLKVDAKTGMLKEDNSHFFEILKNNELHASKFFKFNDMLDCSFSFDVTKNSKKLEKLLEKFYKSKCKKNICCFSKKFKKDDPNEFLMWAHYANSHYGIRIDFELLKNKAIDIKYNKCPFLSNIEKHLVDVDNFELNDKDLENIMTCKGGIWQYENEYRVITDDEKIPINIKKIVIGRAFCKNIQDEREPNLISIIAKEIKNNLKNKNIPIYFYKDRYSNQEIKFKG